MNELQNAIVEKGLSLGWNMQIFDPSNYCADQMLELFAGCLAGIDITQYAFPDMPSEEMQVIRARMADEINYEPSREDIATLESISINTIFIKSIMEEVTCFFSATAESSNDLKAHMEAIEESSAITIDDRMRKSITLEELPEGKVLITTPKGRYTYNITHTANYTIYRNTGLTSLKIKKEAI